VKISRQRATEHTRKIGPIINRPIFFLAKVFCDARSLPDLFVFKLLAPLKKLTIVQRFPSPHRLLVSWTPLLIPPSLMPSASCLRTFGAWHPVFILPNLATLPLIPLSSVSRHTFFIAYQCCPPSDCWRLQFRVTADFVRLTSYYIIIIIIIIKDVKFFS